MRVVDRFKSFGSEAINDAQMQNMTVHIISNKGLALAEMNPALVWIGAAKATLKAGKAYLTYANECKKTKHLEKINIQFEEMIKDEEMIQQEKTKTTQSDAYKQIKKRHSVSQKNRATSACHNINIKSKIKIIEELIGILQNLREKSGDLRLLITFQAQADQCLATTLNLLSEREI